MIIFTVNTDFRLVFGLCSSSESDMEEEDEEEEDQLPGPSDLGGVPWKEAVEIHAKLKGDGDSCEGMQNGLGNRTHGQEDGEMEEDVEEGDEEEDEDDDDDEEEESSDGKLTLTFKFPFDRTKVVFLFCSYSSSLGHPTVDNSYHSNAVEHWPI